jgi:acetyl-CoA C-acetyltransferase
MREVAVIGVGLTKFGELWDKSFRNLISEAGAKAIIDSGISGREIDALYVGSMSAGRFVGQEHVGALVADSSGFAHMHIPSIRVESADASGGLAFRQGYFSVASGMNDIVVIGGVEKMTDVVGSEATDTLATGLDQEWEAFFGSTLAGTYAMIATRHMYDYGTTREQLAKVAVKNHANGALNPYAQFKKAIPIESILNAPMTAYPLGMLDCAPVSDGATALILCAMEKAKKYTDNPVKIIGTSQASDIFAVHGRNNICTFQSSVYAAKKAYTQAGISAEDIDVAEVHDCYTIAEILAIEDLGFVKKGEGGMAIDNKITTLDGKIPVNPSGGLKAKGHPVGATGVAQIAEIVLQLRGDAEKRQIKNAKIGLAHNVGGAGASCVVTLLEAM